MTLNAAKVLVGTADQTSTAGAVRSGAVVTTIPASFSAAETAAAALTGSGYVSEDGVELGNDMSTNDIREWNRNVVRKVLDEFDNTLKWSLIQFDYESWVQVLGSSYVAKTPATSLKGEQLVIKMGAHLSPVQSWAFMLKDGDAKIIIFVPRGQITTLDSITFNATDAIALPVTLSCYDDGTGNTCYIFVDDGKPTGATGA